MPPTRRSLSRRLKRSKASKAAQLRFKKCITNNDNRSCSPPRPLTEFEALDISNRAIKNEQREDDKAPSIEEVVINEDTFTSSTENALHSVIKIEKQELDPLPCTSGGAISSTLLGVNIKEEYDDIVQNSQENGVHLVKPTELAGNDSDMLFCLSLHPSIQKVPEKYRNKAKIDILQVIDRYQTMQ